MIPRPPILALALSLPLAAVPATRGADDPAFPALDAQLRHDVLPLMAKYCHGCHNADKQKGDLDLERFDTVTAARRHTAAWEKTLDQVALGEMPPDDEPQPTAEEKNLLMKWVREFLEAEGRASAGDPGRVVMRRLNNTEYTLTVRDLTGAPLDPAREFPVDGAAGEGFVNVGEALAMSPALFDKYLAAAKDIAAHVVLLPEGFRFSASDRRGDWADEVMAKIRALYARHTDAAGGTAINLQGIQMDTNTGGRLPVEKYLSAAAAEREALAAGRLAPEAAARAHGLNGKYFAHLWPALNTPSSSLLAGVAGLWRARPPAEAAAEVARWQAALTRFQTVGHVKPWMVPTDPLLSRQEVRVKMPAPGASSEITLHLWATDAGDGGEGDATVWEQPRLLMAGRPDVLLRDVRGMVAALVARREALFANSASFLAAAAEAAAMDAAPDLNTLAARHGVPADGLAAWLDCLGIGGTTTPALDYLANHLPPSGQYDFVKGWGSPETPSIIANSSDQTVRVPANLRGHSVALHPSPTLNAAVGWRSPLSGLINVSATVTHAHPECGNGVTWSLELRRGITRQRLAAGTSHGGTPVPVGPINNVPVRTGDLISLVIGPRDGNHSCDTTDVELVIQEPIGPAREWSLARDVSPNILAGNPHADGSGQPSIWHFYTEPVAAADSGSLLPAGSSLARWQSAPTAEERRALATEVQQVLTGAVTPAPDSPDAALRRLLGSLRGPLLGRVPLDDAATAAAGVADTWGVDPARFAPDGSLRLDGPSHLEVKLPSDLVAGCEFATAVTLADPNGSVQVAAALEPPPAAAAGLRAGAPVLVSDQGAARQRFLEAFADFRELFPAALCYPKIIPVDEVITLTVYHREDDHLVRLMLDDAEKAELDRLWEELRYIGQDALTMVDAYAQLLEYASQDSDPKLFFHLKEPIEQRAAGFRKTLADSEPRHLGQLIDFIALAYRRPTTQAEREDVRVLYRTLRDQDMSHEEAFRLTLARLFVAPAFLYRVEQPAAGGEPQPVDDWELASRLSYFLWSSAPDARLRALARAGSLSQPAILRAEARRLLQDGRVRALATEFACQWLHIRDFDQLDEKSERHFPEFKELRDDMYEESVLFFTDLFRNDGPVMDIVDADHTFLNEALATHYGIPGVTGPEWRRLDGMKQHGRGGVLGMATMLAKHSGASRTSPILRGNWLVEVLLGDKLPKPPKGVPPLPEAEDEGDLTMRQITERHSSDPKCFGCHARIDAYGYALEGFDAIGRLRHLDLGGRPIDAKTALPNGVVIDGAAGLRTHLTTLRQEEFLRSFCRKLLGYALGRGLQLSDHPLVADMMHALRQNDYRFTSALDRVLESAQFLRQRGLEATREEEIR